MAAVELVDGREVRTVGLRTLDRESQIVGDLPGTLTPLGVQRPCALASVTMALAWGPPRIVAA